MADEQSPIKCRCWCHAAPDGIWFPHGVDTRNVIEAAAACDYCKPLHCPALLSDRLANAPAPRIVEKVPWVDPPREPPKDDDGN